MKAFSFSLDGAAKDWLYLQSVLFCTSGDMKCMVLERFDDDGLEHDGRCKRWSINGQEVGRNKIVDFEHGKQYVVVQNQRSRTTTNVRQLAVGQHQQNIPTRVYGICTSVKHPTDMCLTLQETEMESVEVVGTIGGH
ncbi:hypothetical protein CR513_26068, partial [Mucuna pruriens]